MPMPAGLSRSTPVRSPSSRARPPTRSLRSGPMNVPEDLRYSAEHEWVRVAGSTARIGITDFAQDSLGDVVFVQLPDVGLDVVAGSSISEIESTKSVSDVYVPLAGKISAVNDALTDQPELVNSDPYGAGWMFEVEITEPEQVDLLLDAAGYRALTEG
jgi:glycine cleavage system H protein